MRPILKSLAILSAVLLPACRQAPHPDTAVKTDSTSAEAATLSPADKAAIHAVDSAAIAGANSGNVDAIVANYAENATVLPPNEPPGKGHEAIRKWWKNFLDAYSVQLEGGADVIEGRGDLAYSLGHYRLKATPKAKGAPPLLDEGKTLTILKRQDDGSWKYVVDMSSSNKQPGK